MLNYFVNFEISLLTLDCVFLKHDRRQEVDYDRTGLK